MRIKQAEKTCVGLWGKSVILKVVWGVTMPPCIIGVEVWVVPLIIVHKVFILLG